MRTSGLPPISASSLFGPPIRVERPAASTIAAIRRPFSGSGSARGCGRVTISISRPPTPRPVTSSRDTGRPASSRIRIQSKPFSFGERAQPGAPRIGWPRACPISIRLPGSTGMPKCSMRAADRLDRGRDHVAPVGDGGGAEHHHQLGARASAPRRPPWRPRACSCGTRRSATIAAPAGASRSSVTRSVFSTTLVASPGSKRRNHADLLDLVGRDADERLAARPRAPRRAPPRSTANGMIFTVAIISPSTTGLKAGKRRERDRLVDPVEPVDRVLVDHQHAGLFGEQVGAAGEGAVDMHALPRHRLGDLGRGLVLGHVARLEPRHHDVLDAGRLQRRNLGGPDQRALLQHQRALADGVDGGGALGLAAAGPGRTSCGVLMSALGAAPG